MKRVVCQFEIEIKMQPKQSMVPSGGKPTSKTQTNLINEQSCGNCFVTMKIFFAQFFYKGATINSDYYCCLLRRMREQLTQATRENGNEFKPLSGQRTTACVKAFLGDNCEKWPANIKLPTAFVRFIVLRLFFVVCHEETFSREEAC